jgi:hypothetical protein
MQFKWRFEGFKMKCIEKILYCSIFISLLLILCNAGSSNARIFSSTENKANGYYFQIDNAIYFSDGINANCEMVFSGANSVIIQSYKVAPNGRHIAIKAQSLERKSAIGHEHAAEYGGNLLITNIEGEILHNFERGVIVAYDWDSVGNYLIVVTGSKEKYGKHVEIPYGDVLSIFDSKIEELKELVSADSNEIFLDAFWALFDGNVYVKKQVALKYGEYEGVFKYDFTSSKFIPTTFKSVDLSPDGKYCFINSNPENTGAELNLTGTEKKVTLITPNKMKQNCVENPDIMFISSLKLIDWLVDRNNTYAIVCNQGIDEALNSLHVTGFWKIDCNTGTIKELPAPNNISPTPGLTNYQLPSGIKDGKLVWAVPNTNGGYQSSILDQ